MRIPSSAMNVADRIIRRRADFYLKCNKFTRQTPEQSDIGRDALRNMTKKHKRKCWDGASRAIAPFCRYFSSPSPPKADHSRIQETRYHVSPHQRNLEYFQFPTVHNKRASVDTSVRDSRRRSRGPQPPIKDNHAESHTASGEIGRRMHTT